MKVSKADFDRWRDDSVTKVVLRYLEQERDVFSRIDFSLAEMSGSYSSDSINLDLNRIGLDSAMRASIVQGIDLVLNTGALEEDLTEAGIIEVQDE